MGKYYIGWDVGAWYCKSHKEKSCDALVILDESNQPVGHSRISISKTILESSSTEEFVKALFEHCGIEDELGEDDKVILAIDTPLGYSQAFRDLITNYHIREDFSFSGKQSEIDSIDNTYLYRKTEQKVFENTEKRPLSAVTHLIGSQSTKGIHVISKFAKEIKSTGVWKDKNERLNIIETYPSINESIQIPEILKDSNSDIQDAYKCAEIARVFDQCNCKLESVTDDIPQQEGWIWYLEEENVLNEK